MKIDNFDLALALNGLVDEIAAARNLRTDAIRAFAQYLADHPTSSTQHPAALELLDIKDMPSETWGQPTPDQAEGERRVADSVQRLNSEYARSTLHAIVALRRLAWDASQLARRLADDNKARRDAALKTNGGHTNRLFLPQPLHDDFTREDYKSLLGRSKRGSGGNGNTGAP
jgi:hypothetical protein